jgi:hypothetical protein
VLEFLAELGLFLAKSVIFVGSIVLIIGVVTSIGQKGCKEERGCLEIYHLNEEIMAMKTTLWQ